MECEVACAKECRQQNGYSGGSYQSHDSGTEPFYDALDKAQAFEPVVKSSQYKHDDARWRHAACGCCDGPGIPAILVPTNVEALIYWTRRHLGYGQDIHELGRSQPGVDLYDLLLYERQRRVSSSEAEQSDEKKLQKSLSSIIPIPPFRCGADLRRFLRLRPKLHLCLDLRLHLYPRPYLRLHLRL